MAQNVNGLAPCFVFEGNIEKQGSETVSFRFLTSLATLQSLVGQLVEMRS